MTEEQYENIVMLLGDGELKDNFKYLWRRYNKLKAQNMVYMMQKPPVINVYYDKPVKSKEKK